jgi:glucose-6-phosphate dehydrogenase assembly protein OpcA
MSTAYKVLGQSAPAATTDTNLYTVPASTQAVVSTIAVCNRAASTSTFRIAVRPAGETIANQHYLIFDVTVAASDSIFLTIGATLNASDVITVRSSSANLSFSVFGSEIT